MSLIAFYQRRCPRRLLRHRGPLPDFVRSFKLDEADVAVAAVEEMTAVPIVAFGELGTEIKLGGLSYPPFKVGVGLV